jgi:hypothetical protein
VHACAMGGTQLLWAWQQSEPGSDVPLSPCFGRAECSSSTAAGSGRCGVPGLTPNGQVQQRLTLQYRQKPCAFLVGQGVASSAGARAL